MMQFMLFSLMMVFNFIFMQMTHPLAMGLMLLVQTLTICLITGLFAKTFWFSYILFLVFLGGMLVLFIYVTSLASNEMFSLSMKLTIYSTIMIFMLLILSFIFDKMSFSLFISNNEMQPLNILTSYMPENSINLYKLYNYPTNMITLMLMNYLLVTLIAVVKITKLFYGPLRPMN